MKRIIARTLVVTLAVALAALATACSSKPNQSAAEKSDAASATPLKIGYLPITHSAPLMLADASVGGQPVELVKFSSWPELTDALNAGRVDGAVTMLEIAMASAEKGVPLKLVALSHRDGDALTVAKDITSAADLKGQRVAIPHRLSGHNLILKLALEREGLTLDDVTRVEMPPGDMPAALGRGDVKAFIAAEPFGTMGVVKSGGRALVSAAELWPDWLCCGLVLRDSVIAERPDDVQALVDQFAASGASIGRDPSAAAKSAAQYTQYDEAVWKKSFELGVTYSDLVPTTDELERLKTMLAEEKLIEGKVDAKAFLDDSFITRAAAEL